MLNPTDRIISQNEYCIDFDQQDFIEKNYKAKNLLEITRECFSQDDLDKHSSEYSNVRKFIAKLKRGVECMDFDDDQIEYIKNNAALMRPIDIAKVLWPNANIRPLCREQQTVDKYIKALGLGNPDIGTDQPNTDYSPPKASSKIVARINAEDINANFKMEDLTGVQKKDIETLRGYLHSKRFLTTINAINRDSHRSLFEGTFIQSTYDKPDLNAEELNMYISLCRDYVFATQVQEQLETINTQIDNFTGDSEEIAGLRMNLIEAYSSKMDEYHKIQARMEKLQINLSDKRNTRIKNTAQLNNSLTKFVELWKSDEERKKNLIIAKARDLQVSDEIKRVASFAEYIALVQGISEEELLSH
jgi:hypothetical protein